ncbi:MAG: hypothetical protein EBT26_02005 [Microbacteriaceae bacterium]|nr:hypothetical protein [Microbacteriaceae bacterium]NBS60818.1 hypothetical protein [Microbacteriaceae bacterium]
MWKIIKLECLLNYNNLQNVVLKAYWEYTISQDNEQETISGIKQFTAPSEDNFIPYENLTEQIVLDWLWKEISKQATEELAIKKLNDKINPPIISLSLPW